MKGCLRKRSPSPALPEPVVVDDDHHKKCVAFTEQGPEMVHTADEWDRTPVEPSRNLSYEDILELKEIQNSLPRAQQLPEFYNNTRTKQYLSGVPVVLLPIFASNTPSPSSSPSQSGDNSPIGRPSSPTSSSTTTCCLSLSSSDSRTCLASTPASPSCPSSMDWTTISFRAPNKDKVKPKSPVNKPFIPPPPPTPFISPWTPPHLAHLVPKSPIPVPAAAVRQRPSFAFLPMMPSDREPRKSASPTTGSFPKPSSSSSSRSSRPPSLIHTDTDTETETETETETDIPTPPRPPLSVFSEYFGVDDYHRHGDSRHDEAQVVFNPPGVMGLDLNMGMDMEKKRKFILVNGVEVELDEDEDEEQCHDGEDEDEEYYSTSMSTTKSKNSPEDTALSEARLYNMRLLEMSSTCLYGY